MITQTQIMTTLSYLLGERTIPSTATENRTDFIQRTIEEIYRAYPFPFASATATVAVVGGTATLPTDVDWEHQVTAYFYAGDTQKDVREINAADQDKYNSDDTVFWLQPITNTDNYTFNTKDTSYGTVFVRYQTVPPTVDATIGTPFTDIMTIALGARRYVKLGQNPDADIAQDEALFQKRLGENIAAVQVNRPLRRNRKLYYANGYRLGDG
jgi:hypothetical protein